MTSSANNVQRLPVSEEHRLAVDNYRHLDDSLRAARAQCQQLRARHRHAEVTLHGYMVELPRALIADGSSIKATIVQQRAPITAAIVQQAALDEGVDRARVARMLERIRVQKARAIVAKPCISRRFYSN